MKRELSILKYNSVFIPTSPMVMSGVKYIVTDTSSGNCSPWGGCGLLRDRVRSPVIWVGSSEYNCCWALKAVNWGSRCTWWRCLQGTLIGRCSSHLGEDHGEGWGPGGKIISPLWPGSTLGLPVRVSLHGWGEESLGLFAWAAAPGPDTNGEAENSGWEDHLEYQDTTFEYWFSNLRWILEY